VWGGATFAVGAAIDRGHGRAVMTFGALAGGLGCLAWSQVSAPWMLYAVWVVLGAAMAATLYEPAFAVLTKRYPERYRQGITALTLVGGFASTLSFPAAAALLARLGWRPALAVMGIVLLAVAPLHHWALRGPAIVAAAQGAAEADDATLRQALREAAFWLLTLCFTLYAFVQAALWAHVMPAFAAKGVGQADALTVLVCIGPAQVAGRLLYVWLGRGWSLRVLGAVVLAGLPLAMLLFALGRSLAVLLLFALLFGIANGLVTIVRGGLVPQYFGRAHVGRIGGLMSGIGLVARAGGPVLVAWLLVLLPGYRELLLLLAACGVVSVVAFWLARPPASSRAT
jgi:MFS family permease